MSISSALAGALSSGGNIFSNMFGSVASSAAQYELQKKLQINQQNWLEKMSNTAHQREMNDLRAAGLNPLLTVMGGSGASTPSSGMGNITAPDISGAISDARQYNLAKRKTDAEIKKIKAETTAIEGTKENITGNIINFLKNGTTKDIINFVNKFRNNFLDNEKETSSAKNIFKLRAEKNQYDIKNDKVPEFTIMQIPNAEAKDLIRKKIKFNKIRN